MILLPPLIWVLSHFVSYADLDRTFKFTDYERPQILHAVTEQLDTGYSKNFIINSPQADNTMLFYALPGHRVRVSVDAKSRGSFPPITVYINRCPMDKRTEDFHFPP